MDTAIKNGNNVDPDITTAVTLDDLSEEDRREIEREIEEDQAKMMKLMLAGYRKTRDGVVKKVSAPSSSDPLGAEVKKPTENITHLIDVSVASKHDSDITDMSRTLRAVASKFENFKEQLEASIPRNVSSALIQISDEKSGIKPMLPAESSRSINFHNQTTGASANLAQQPDVALNIDQIGRNHAGSVDNFSSVVLQSNDGRPDKKLMPLGNSRSISCASNIHTHGASVSAAQQLHATLSNNQDGRNHVSSSAKSFVSNVAHQSYVPLLHDYQSGRNYMSSSANLESSLAPHVRSLLLQNSDAYYEKSLMAPDSSKLNNFPTYTCISDASAHVAQAQVLLDNNQGGWNYLSSPANNYMPSVAAPNISTSVPHNYHNNNRSASFNSSLQQDSYQTVPYSILPLLPIGTGVPYGPIPDSSFSGSPLQTSHAQISLPEIQPRACVPSTRQTNSPQPSGSFKDQLDSILREFGLEPKGRARVNQKPYPDYFDSMQENRAEEIKQYSRFSDNKNKDENHDSSSLDNGSDSASKDDIDICVAEWVQTPNSNPFTCSTLKPTTARKEEMKYTFDVTKCDMIFDILLQGKLIRLREGHVIPSSGELGKRVYCKYHNAYSHSTNDCNVFQRQVQSAINDGRLTFTKNTNTKLDSDSSPINVIEFENKKVLIRSDQTESTKGKNVVIDDNAAPRMIKPKNSEVGVWKVNGGKRQTPRPKPTVSLLLAKYTTRKADNVFNRFGGIKRPKFPSRHGDHEHWRINSYDEQPYYPLESAYLGCTSPMYPQFSPLGFNLRAQYPARPSYYFRSQWPPSRIMCRKPWHGRKRAWPNQRARPCDGNVIRGSDERPGASDTRGRHNADGIIIIGGQKFKWVPVRGESHIKHVVTFDEYEHGCTNNNAAEDMSVHASVEPNVHTRSEKEVVLASSIDSADASAGIFTGGTESRRGAKIFARSGSVQNKDINTEARHLDSTYAASSSTSQKTESVNMHTDPSMRNSSSRTFRRLSPLGLKSCSSTCTQRANPSKRGGQDNGSGGVSDQRRCISAKDRMFVPGTTIRQYWLRDSGGKRIKSVAPGTKPGLRWCPMGLTHTQKWRVQRLRALEMKQEIAEKKCDELFNREKPMVSKMIWRKKHIAGKESKVADDTAANLIDDTIDGKDAENSKEIPTDMNMNIVFTIPAEFCAPKV